MSGRTITAVVLDLCAVMAETLLRFEKFYRAACPGWRGKVKYDRRYQRRSMYMQRRRKGHKQ